MKNTNKADTWQKVPGACWFKADLHIHTIDDHPGGAKWSEGRGGNPDDPECLRSYARNFLQSAVSNTVQVLGLTPHSPRSGSTGETSAVWHIVDEWKKGIDDDKIPFREKIYAVFPGFEPNLRNGKNGLHLLFLFDPEIGRDRYLRVFDLLMGGASPYHTNNALRISSRSAEECFNELRSFFEREGQPSWRYMVLAPHIESNTGLIGAQKGQLLQLFQHNEVRGLELSDNKLPEDTLKGRPWLKDGMQKYRQGFYHGSDAYSPENIGKRHVWIKLASPTIEALRQAFIANESRIRIGFEYDKNGELQTTTSPPAVTLSARPWLRSVRLKGRASFFGGLSETGGEESRFDFSPDLTCIIGGSMTGKSSLLDGLRMHVGAQLPDDPVIREQVEQRGGHIFLAGSPEIEFDCPGADTTMALHDRWPAIFYSQNELQRLADEPASVEEILTRLDPAESEKIREREQRLRELDAEVKDCAKQLNILDEELSEAEQALERALNAQKELDAFAEAGVKELHDISRKRLQWQEVSESEEEIKKKISNIAEEAKAFELPHIDDNLTESLKQQGMSAEYIPTRVQNLSAYLQRAKDELESWHNEMLVIIDSLEVNEKDLHTRVERALADQGVDASRIKEFQTLSKKAALAKSYQANLDTVKEKRQKLSDRFATLLEERNKEVDTQRSAFDRVLQRIFDDFGGRIRASRIQYGSVKELEQFIRDLRQKGITQWWNNAREGQYIPSPQKLYESIENDSLRKIGMTEPVRRTFLESMTEAKKREMLAIRSPDLYVLEQRVDEQFDDDQTESQDIKYRRLDKLSGGRRVSVLLSLLLKTFDERPLIIDQPEDQLDNRFLFEEVLPALKALKGKRQIIVATHNANIVVNGDADQVIQLEASGTHGRVACVGAIEEPEVRDAIVATVDGGDEAFRLRRLKYGF